MSGLDVIQNAEALLDNGNKWCQAKFYDHLTGERCLLGALLSSENGFTMNDRKEAVAAARIAVASTGWEDGNLARYNDHITRRWDEIKEVLDKAAEVCKGGGDGTEAVR